MNENNINANRTYKDSVFTLLFSEKTERLISLYNALSGKNYPSDVAVEINTLEDALIMERLNDIAFEIDGKIVVLIEHLSTLNRLSEAQYNMPLRCWLYASRIYKKILDGENIYRDRLIKLPKPEFYVCYNGEEPLREKDRVLRLSDAVEEANPQEFELAVKVFDVNKNRGDEILKKSMILNEYAEFIETVREIKQTGVSLSEALTKAINECINKGILREFLEKHGSEVYNMLYVKFDIDVAKEIWREEGIEKGIEKGVEQGKIETIKNLFALGMSVEQIARASEFSVEKVRQIKDSLEK